MSDDVKLSEGDPIDLEAQPLDGGFELPKSDDSDFDLDQFLAENADENTANVDLDLSQSGFSFDNNAEQSPENVDLADIQEDPDIAFKNEIEQVPDAVSGIDAVENEEIEAGEELETKSEPETETGMEPVEDVEVEESSEVEASAGAENVSDAIRNEDEKSEYVDAEGVGKFDFLQTEEDVVNDEKSKGWAFEGIDDAVAGSEEDEALNMHDDEVSSFETPVSEDVEPENVQTEDETTDSYVDEDVVEKPIESNVEQEKRVGFDYEQGTADVGATSLGSQQTVYDLQETDGYAKWYSGNYDDGAFEVDRQSVSGVLNGDDAHRTIHVSVGYGTYGWQVEFANGVVMNLRDVREYQLKNGKLPAEDGAIVYGDMRIEFHYIEKITLYESIRYFTYMPN